MTDPVVTPPTVAPPATPPTDDLPPWVRKAITDANNEAAKYRTELRNMETKFAGAKTQAEFEAATAALTTTNAQLERSLLVAKVAKGDPSQNIPPLPDVLADLLQGNTEAELREHANKLRALIPGATTTAPTTPPATPPANLAGGLTPGGEGGDDGFDAAKVAAQLRKRFR